MQISWNGLGCFSLLCKPAQTEVTLVTNPFSSQADTKLRGGVATILVQSHVGIDTSNIQAFTPEHPEAGRSVFVVSHAGEYEVQGIFVTGIHAPLHTGDAHTIYRFDVENMRVAFLGALDRVLTPKEVDLLGPIDILLIPGGGTSVISPEVSAGIVRTLEPRIVIPSYVGGAFASPEVFMRALGSTHETLPKLKITRAQLPEEDMRAVLLE